MDVDSSDNGSWHPVGDMDAPGAEATTGPSMADHAGSAAASSRVTAQQATAEMHKAFGSARSIAEATGKIIDLKNLCKPEVFTGEEKKWHEWRFRMDNLF